MTKIGVFLADGFEEIEGLTVVDVLRRAGVEVTAISIMGRKEIYGAHQIAVLADELFENIEFESLHGLVLPGGMPGTTNLGAHDGVKKQIKEFAEEGKMVAAICAAPSVLGENGILKGKKAVCYPSFEEKLNGAEVLFQETVQDGNVITSRGMGTAISFSLSIIEYFINKEKAEEIAEAIIYKR